LVSHKF